MFGWIKRKQHERRAAAYLDMHPEDRPAVEAILFMVDGLGTKSARHVAEALAGRPFSDAEWQPIGARWERAWFYIVGR